VDETVQWDDDDDVVTSPASTAPAPPVQEATPATAIARPDDTVAPLATSDTVDTQPAASDVEAPPASDDVLPNSQPLTEPVAAEETHTPDEPPQPAVDKLDSAVEAPTEAEPVAAQVESLPQQPASSRLVPVRQLPTLCSLLSDVLTVALLRFRHQQPKKTIRLDGNNG
jgi:hypothetical protein